MASFGRDRPPAGPHSSSQQAGIHVVPDTSVGSNPLLTASAPDDVLDELDRLGFYEREPRTLVDARRVLALAHPPVPNCPSPSAAAAAGSDKRRQRQSQAARGIRSGDVERRRGDHISAGKWRKGTGIEVRRCLLPGCDKLVFSHATQHVPTELHRTCMIKAMREPAVRDWLSQRRQARDAGKPLFAINRTFGVRMPIDSAPRAHSETLTRDFAWAVRHLLGGESQSELARSAGVTQPAVAQAIKRILQLLPDQELVPKYYRPLLGRISAHAVRRSA
jgi:hypothetical protein